jgi:hypothetical protein
MAELKNMTVQALRDLAKKALGRGHSRLKTKGDLVAALQAAEKKVSGAAEKAAVKVKEATGRAAKAAGKMMDAARSPAKKGAASRARPAAEPRKAKASEPPVAAKKPAERKGRAGKTTQEKGAAKAIAPEEKAATPVEPDPEGHFVARVRGEEAVREAPHPMTEATAAAQPVTAPPRKGLRAEHHYEEDLGELPWSYGDDAFIALPRDPRTLFLYWDHAEQTLRSAWDELDGGRPQLWLYERRADGGWERIRTVEFALESRSYYIHDLDPGRAYRAEIHVVDRLGRTRLVGAPSNDMELPPMGASAVVDDRFMRLPWGEPLQRLLHHVREGGPFPEELRAQFARLSDWGRFGETGGGGSAGGIGGVGAVGRPGSAPSSPSSPWGPPGPSGRGEGR